MTAYAAEDVGARVIKGACLFSGVVLLTVGRFHHYISYLLHRRRRQRKTRLPHNRSSPDDPSSCCPVEIRDYD
jgi:hypothetical protein